MFLGIDLGTTYSACACVNDEGEVSVVKNSEGEATTPSVVYFESKEQVVVGQKAKDMTYLHPMDVISFVKTMMGQKTLLRTTHGDYSPEVVSSFILKKVVEDANATLQNAEHIKDVVVTIPAYFSDPQRMATEDAIALAGLNRIALINEPTAAAFYYVTKNAIRNANLMVYDLGGGTFDVTVVHVDDNGRIKVISTGGLSKVGGSFFDKMLTRKICNYFKEKHGIDIFTPDRGEDYKKILLKSEKSKIQLSSVDETVMTVKVDDVTENITLRREDINEIVADLYLKTESVMKKALREAHLTTQDIGKVILVGGSSRIPYIAEHIENFIGKKPSMDVNPDEVVALGAALYAHEMKSEGERRIIDICSHGIGIRAMDSATGKEYNDILIPKNSPLPASVERTYEFAEDGVDNIYINVFEGDFREISDVTEVCEVFVNLPVKLKIGEQVVVKLVLDINQILHIFIRIPSASNIETEVRFDRKSNLKEIEFTKWKKSISGIVSGAIDKVTSQFSKNDTPKEQETQPVLQKDEEKRSTRKVDRDLKPILSIFENVIGFEEVINALGSYKHRFVDAVAKSRVFGRIDNDDRCIAIFGERGMGITKAATLTAQALYKMGASKIEQPAMPTFEDIVKDEESKTIEAIKALFEGVMDGVILIDDIDRFYDDDPRSSGMVALNLIMEAYYQAEKRVTIIIAGDTKTVTKLFEKNPRFERLFDTFEIELNGFSSDEYVRILHQFAEETGYIIDDAADEALEKYFRKQIGSLDFQYLYSVYKLLEDAKTKVADAAAHKRHATDDDYTIIRKEHFGELSGAKSFDELMNELNSLTGLKSVKIAINEMVGVIKARKRAKEQGRAINTELGSLHMVFTGNPGTGKTTVARLIGELYRELGVLERGQFIEVSRQDLISDIIGATAPRVTDFVEKATGGILFIDEAYSLCRDENDIYGREAIDTLVKLIEDRRDSLMVILAGYSKEMSTFMSQNSGMSSRFSTYIEFEDYTSDEMMEIFNHYMEQDHYILEGRAQGAVRTLILEKMRMPDFGNARGVRKLYEAIRRQQQKRLADLSDWGENEEKIIRCEDIGVEEQKVETVDDILDSLRGMIGLATVKNQVESLVNMARVNQVRKSQGLKPLGGGSLHMIFLGNPGTGKTTVARKIGKIYQALGYLTQGDTIEVSRADLVGEFVGTTAPKTEKVIRQAIGNVLFIDEAYTLSNSGSNNDYGREAIDTLVKGIYDNKDNLVVILAGYETEMKKFLAVNEGLSSRFPNKIFFEDYTVDEMMDIFVSMITKDELKATPEALDKVRIILEQNSSNQKSFGNGRGVENLKFKIETNMANRHTGAIVAGKQLTKEELITILPEDIGI